MKKTCKKLLSIAVTIAMCATILVPVNVSANTAGFDTWFSALPTLTDQTVEKIKADTTVNDANYAEFYDYLNQPYRRISTSSNSVKVSSMQTWNESGGNDRRGYAILKLDQVDDIYGTNKGTYVYDVDLNINLTGEVTEKGDRTPLSTSGGSRTNMNGVYIGFFGGADGAENLGYSVINLFRDKAVETSERVSNDRAVELATFAGEGLENGKYKMVYEYATGTSASEAKANIYMYKYNADGVTYNTTPVMSVIGKNLKTMPGSTSKEQWSSQTKESLGWIQIGVRTPDIGSYIEVTKASFSKLPEGITLSEASVLMEINATKQLSATVLPSDATNKKVIWTSSNQGVATVNENGLVTAVSSGTATITATTESGGKTAECVVTVNEPAASSYSEWFSTLPTLTDQTIENIQANTRVNDANYAEFYDYPNQPYRRISTSSNSVKVSSVQTWNESGGNDRRGYAILKLDQVDDIYGTNKGTYVYDVDLNINLTGEVTEKGDRTPLSTSGGSRTNMNGVYIGFFGGADGAETPGYGYSVINLFRDKAVETSERVSNDRAVELATFAGEGLENGKYKMVYEYATGTSASEAKANIYMYKYNADGVTYNTTPVMSVIGKNLKTMPGSTSKEQWSSQTKESLGWIQIGVRTPDIGSYIEVTKASFSKLPEGITLSEASVLMEINATKQLSATVLPSDATNKKVIWTSSNQGVATVNENGLVTAVSSGTATITATTESGGKTAECVVTVNEPAASSYSEWFSTLPTLTDQTIENIQANTRVNDANYAEFYDYLNQPYRRISTSSNSVKVSSIQTWNESGGNDRRGYAILKLDQVDDIYGTNKGTYVYDVDLNINLTGEVTEKGDRTPLSTSGGSRTNMNGVYIGFFGGADGAENLGYGYSVINLFRDKAVETSERVSNDRAVELATFAGEGLENGKYKMVYEYATGTSASEAKANIYMYKYNADGVTYNTTPVMSVIGKNLKTMPGSTSKEQWSSQTKESLGWIQIGVRTPDIGSCIEVTKASFSKKALPTTIEGYFANLPVLTDVKPSVANADEFVNIENIASLTYAPDRDAYFKVSSKPGAIKLASDYSWESQFRNLALNMKLGNIENIYGSNKTYEYNIDFNLNFSEDTENGYLCRLPNTYTDENTKASQQRRNIGFFNFGSSTNLLLYRNGIMSHDGGTETVEFDSLLENGEYTLQLLYHAEEDSQKSSISVNLIYKGVDGTAAPVVIPCYSRVKTKFMVGETNLDEAVTTGTIGTFQAGIGAPPKGSYMEITGATLTSKNSYDTFVFKSMDYSQTDNIVTVTGTYDYTNGADERNAHVQYAALFTNEDKFVACGIANESSLREGQHVTWESTFNYDGKITSGMKIKLFVWEDMKPAIDVQTITID